MRAGEQARSFLFIDIQLDLDAQVHTSTKISIVLAVKHAWAQKENVLADQEVEYWFLADELHNTSMTYRVHLVSMHIHHCIKEIQV